MYKGRNKEKTTDNGFIYPIINKFIQLIFYVNIVELIKWITIKIVLIYNKNPSDINTVERKKRKARNFAIDIFISLKFIFIGIMWFKGIDNIYFVGITIYLLIMNSFVYFYYHVWEEGAIKGQYATVHRTRRKFISLFQSVLYMVLTYGYLFQIPFKNEFQWTETKVTFSKSLLFSLSNTFPLSYDNVKALTEMGQYIRVSQILLSFLFITIILTQSIPKTKDEKTT
ncbi:hypothetical protein [Bacillus thuringiensis]|uniref:Uncharacterized protein n=1 Tax=Bacillus thuringiensis TaxID=1428 RepID=A0A9X7FVM9_BACTU|nr:hypothetical protein [Bacillus thuringiensis]PFT45022.1 hypothetical protein COK72_15180 [Bacillus thuringiensis]